MPNAPDTNIARAVRQVARPLTGAASDCGRYFFKFDALARSTLRQEQVRKMFYKRWTVMF